MAITTNTNFNPFHCLTFCPSFSNSNFILNRNNVNVQYGGSSSGHFIKLPVSVQAELEGGRVTLAMFVLRAAGPQQLYHHMMRTMYL